MLKVLVKQIKLWFELRDLRSQEARYKRLLGSRVLLNGDNTVNPALQDLIKAVKQLAIPEETRRFTIRAWWEDCVKGSKADRVSHEQSMDVFFRKISRYHELLSEMRLTAMGTAEGLLESYQTGYMTAEEFFPRLKQLMAMMPEGPYHYYLCAEYYYLAHQHITNSNKQDLAFETRPHIVPDFLKLQVESTASTTGARYLRRVLNRAGDIVRSLMSKTSFMKDFYEELQFVKSRLYERYSQIATEVGIKSDEAHEIQRQLNQKQYPPALYRQAIILRGHGQYSAYLNTLYAAARAHYLPAMVTMSLHYADYVRDEFHEDDFLKDPCHQFFTPAVVDAVYGFLGTAVLAKDPRALYAEKIIYDTKEVLQPQSSLKRVEAIYNASEKDSTVAMACFSEQYIAWRTGTLISASRLANVFNQFFIVDQDNNQAVGENRKDDEKYERELKEAGALQFITRSVESKQLDADIVYDYVKWLEKQAETVENDIAKLRDQTAENDDYSRKMREMRGYRQDMLIILYSAARAGHVPSLERVVTIYDKYQASVVNKRTEYRYKAAFSTWLNKDNRTTLKTKEGEEAVQQLHEEFAGFKQQIDSLRRAEKSKSVIAEESASSSVSSQSGVSGDRRQSHKNYSRSKKKIKKDSNESSSSSKRKKSHSKKKKAGDGTPATEKQVTDGTKKSSHTESGSTHSNEQQTNPKSTRKSSLARRVSGSIKDLVKTKKQRRRRKEQTEQKEQKKTSSSLSSENSKETELSEGHQQPTTHASPYT